jgi:hypothetical protein
VTGAGLRALVGKGTSNRTTFFREMNFYEKAQFVKPTWRDPRGRVQRLSTLRAMLLFALSGNPLFGGSVHRVRSVLIRAKGAAIFGAVSPL